MNKFLAVNVIVIAGLVVAVTFLTFQTRALTIKIQRLEAAQARPATAKEPVEPTAPRAAPTAPVEWEAPPERRIEPAAAPAKKEESKASGADLSPAIEQAVAKSVDRILEEKYGHLPKVNKPEDLEKTLERELNLTASQKERIAGLLKKKREESAEIFKGTNPFAGKTLQKAMELNAKYDQLIKNELDNDQQAKYDQLKKDGKIADGITISIDGTDDGSDEK